MPVGTLQCPNCGGAVSSDTTACQYCRARLVTVSCPQCFGLAFIGSKFCSHCGASLAAVVSEGTSILPCPRCNDFMQQRTLRDTTLTECDKCDGLWIDTASFQRICADRQSQASILGSVAGAKPNATFEVTPKYLRCPRCQQLMNRLNFAHCSGVIIDFCRPHGVWFDRDELRRIIEFVASGGMDRARELQIERLESSRRELHNLKRSLYEEEDQTVSAFQFAGAVLRKLLD